jgi:hypothetical protein
MHCESARATKEHLVRYEADAKIFTYVDVENRGQSHFSNGDYVRFHHVPVYKGLL